MTLPALHNRLHFIQTVIKGKGLHQYDKTRNLWFIPTLLVFVQWFKSFSSVLYDRTKSHWHFEMACFLQQLSHELPFKEWIGIHTGLPRSPPRHSITPSIFHATARTAAITISFCILRTYIDHIWILWASTKLIHSCREVWWLVWESAYAKQLVSVLKRSSMI